MFSFDKRLALAPVLFGLGLTGFAVSSGQAATDPNAPIQCGVASHTDGGMLMIEGVVLAKSNLGGSYQFQLNSSSGGGNNSISQGGNFSATAHQVTTLGQVSINAGSRYTLDFTIQANGQKLDCTQTFDWRY